MIDSITHSFRTSSVSFYSCMKFGLIAVDEKIKKVFSFFSINLGCAKKKISSFSFTDLRKYVGYPERVFFGKNYPLLVKTAMCVSNIGLIRIDTNFKENLPHEATKFINEAALAHWFQDLDLSLDFSKPIILTNPLAKNKFANLKTLDVTERSDLKIPAFVDISWVLDGEVEENCQLKLYDSSSCKENCRKVLFSLDDTLELKMETFCGVKKEGSKNVVHPDFHPISFREYTQPTTKFLRFNLELDLGFSFYLITTRNGKNQSTYVIEVKDLKLLTTIQNVISESCSVFRFLTELSRILNHDLGVVKEKLKIVDIK